MGKAMQRAVVFLDGPIGLGKTYLGRAGAASMSLGFIDGDDHSTTGHWLRSALRTSRRIVAASEDALHNEAAVLVAYPLRCKEWVFFSQTFERMGIACHCICLAADIAAISARERELDADEIARSAEMTAQGCGSRPFGTARLRTDEFSLSERVGCWRT